MGTWGDRLLSAALGGLMTFVAMYITVVGSYITRADVSQMISKESPYVRDQRWIAEKLTSIEKKLDRLLDEPH